MAETNISAVLHGKNDLRLEDTPIRSPKHGEVKIQMYNCGICGTDLHLVSEGSCGGRWYVKDNPVVIGHEGSGIVVEVGDGVKHLKVGDRVTIEPGVPCRMCSYCTAGRYNLCETFEFCGQPGRNGVMKQFHIHRADLVFRLPDNVSLEEGAFMEPVSVAVHACNKGSITFGQKVLISGSGTIGLLCMLTAKAYGATKICVTDTSEHRLQKAKELGADYVKLIKDGEDSTSVARSVEMLFGEQPHVCLECSGFAGAVPVAVYSVRPGGKVVIVGIYHDELIPTPIVNAGIREVELIGVMAYANCFPKALELVSCGKVDVKSLITHRYNIEDLHDALEIVRQKLGIKVMINCCKKPIEK